MFLGSRFSCSLSCFRLIGFHHHQPFITRCTTPATRNSCVVERSPYLEFETRCGDKCSLDFHLLSSTPRYHKTSSHRPLLAFVHLSSTIYGPLLLLGAA